MENKSWIDEIALKIAEREELGLPYDDIINEYINWVLANTFSSDNNNSSKKAPDLRLVKGVDDFKMYLDCFYFKFSCCDTLEKFMQVNELYRNQIRKKYYFLDFYRSIPFKVDRETLHLEFSTAHSVISSVLDWQNYHFTKHIFPYIQFRTVIDVCATELCHTLKDVVLEIDNPYLDFIFPPNFFGDRTCMALIRRANLEDKTLKLKIDPRFAHNFGKYYKLEEDKPFFVVPNSEENMEVVKRFYKKNA